MKPIHIVGLVIAAIFSLWLWSKIPYIALGVVVLTLVFFKGAKIMRGENDD